MKAKIGYELTIEEKKALEEAITHFKLESSKTVSCTMEHSRFWGHIRALEGILKGEDQ